MHRADRSSSLPLFSAHSAHAFFPTLLTPTLVVALLAFFPKAKPTRPARSSPSPTPLQASASRSVVVPAARSGVDRGRSQEEDGEPGVREEGGRVGRQGRHRTPLPLLLHPQVRTPPPTSLDRSCSSSHSPTPSPSPSCPSDRVSRPLCKHENRSRMRDGLACAAPSVILRDR